MSDGGASGETARAACVARSSTAAISAGGRRTRGTATPSVCALRGGRGGARGLRGAFVNGGDIGGRDDTRVHDVAFVVHLRWQLRVNLREQQRGNERKKREADNEQGGRAKPVAHEREPPGGGAAGSGGGGSERSGRPIMNRVVGRNQSRTSASRRVAARRASVKRLVNLGRRRLLIFLKNYLELCAMRSSCGACFLAVDAGACASLVRSRARVAP